MFTTATSVASLPGAFAPLPRCRRTPGKQAEGWDGTKQNLPPRACATSSLFPTGSKRCSTATGPVMKLYNGFSGHLNLLVCMGSTITMTVPSTAQHTLISSANTCTPWCKPMCTPQEVVHRHLGLLKTVKKQIKNVIKYLGV